MAGDKPSRESMREVKREYRERQRAQRARRRRPSRSKRHLRVVADAPARRLGGQVKRLVTTLMGLGLVAVMVGAGMAVFGRPPGPPSARAADRVPVLVPSPAPTPSKQSQPLDPFAGSAVDHWPVGEAGVVAPAAKPVGRYTAAQVGDAYARTVAYLEAAMLDRRVVFGRDLRPVVATLDAKSVRGIAPVFVGNVFPRDVIQAYPGVRVNGFLAPRLHDGDLMVDFRYVAVYAVKPARGGEDELVTIRRVGTLLFRAAGRSRVTPAWRYLSSYTSSHSRCGWTWPDGNRSMFVSLGPDEAVASATATPQPGPRETVNLLDPRAKDPERCFDNSGKL